MAVVGFARELGDSPKGDFSLTKHSFTRVFLVQTDDYADGPIIVSNALGLPRPYQFYTTGNELNPYARCRHVRPERLAPNSLVWRVECDYDTPDPNKQDAEGAAENPLLEIPEIAFDFTLGQTLCLGEFDEEDAKGLTNSAGELFDPQVQKDDCKIMLTITRNEDILTPHPALALGFVNRINQDFFWGAEPGDCKCQGIKVARETKMTPSGIQVIYLKTTYVFEFRSADPPAGSTPDNADAGGWDLQLLDIGTFYFEDGKKIAFKTKDQHPRIGLLNGFGGALPDETDPFWLPPKQIYEAVAFAALNLPNTFI